MTSTTTITSNLIYIKESTAGEWEYSFDNINFTLVGANAIIVENPYPEIAATDVYFIGDLTVTQTYHYFVVGSDNIRFNGAQGNLPTVIKTINSSVDNLVGLFQNGDSSFPGKNNIIITQFHFINQGNKIYTPTHGHLIQPYFGKSSTDIQLSYLSNESDINSYLCGGIGGSNVGLNSTNFKIAFNTNTGNINGYNSSGLYLGNLFALLGFDPSFNSTNNNINNCTNTGYIIGDSTCGLFASFSFQNCSNLSISYCYNYGNCAELLVHSNLFGRSCFERTSDNLSISHCYNFGKIVGDAGVFGTSCFISSSANIEISNCGNMGQVGKLNDTYVGGVFGVDCFLSMTSTSTIRVLNCFNLGDIYSDISAGVFGPKCFRNSNSLVIIKNIYNTGSLGYSLETNTNISGIFGYLCFVNSTSTISIQNVYNEGNFLTKNSGGIFVDGVFTRASAGVQVIDLTNIYNNSNLNDISNGGIFGPLVTSSAVPIEINIKNIYSVYYDSLYSANSIYNTQSPLPANVSINLISPVSSDLTWNQTNAASTLLVSNFNNDYNSYTFDGFVDINIITSSTPSLSNIPYQLYFGQQLYLENSTYLPGAPINPIQPQTFGTFSLISSETLNLPQNKVFGTIDSSSGVVTVNPDLASQANVKTLVYKEGAIRNPYSSPETVYQQTFLFSLFASNIDGVCLTGWNQILCADGRYVKIENCRPGDLVYTPNGCVPIKYIYKSQIHNKNNNNETQSSRVKDKLYVIPKAAYPELFQDVVLTGGHPILVDAYSPEELIIHRRVWPNSKEHRLENKCRLLTFLNDKAKHFEQDGLYDIYNIVLENSCPEKNYMIYVNGILTESLSETFYHRFSLK